MSLFVSSHKKGITITIIALIVCSIIGYYVYQQVEPPRYTYYTTSVIQPIQCIQLNPPIPFLTLSGAVYATINCDSAVYYLYAKPSSTIFFTFETNHTTVSYHTCASETCGLITIELS